jgi:hypothetical protein
MRALTIVFAACLPLFASSPLPRVESVTTEKSDFAPGGTVRIEGSTGELNIEGWDQPSVEVTVTRYTWDANAERAKRNLDRVQVAKPAASGTEISIVTTHKKSLSVHVNYNIRVPRDSKLIIRQGIGDVVVYGVGGDIDATAKAGDILLQLPATEKYSIDAKNKAAGDIYSDYEGKAHYTWVLMGDKLESETPAPARHLRLRVRFGGIAIQKVGQATPPV